MNHTNVSLGQVSTSSSDTNETLRNKARTHLPTALKDIGEKLADEAWLSIKKGVGDMMDISYSAKTKFTRESVDDYIRNASLSDKKELEDSIFEQLKKQRDSQ
jgi:hypothetical protein